jgi:hypothetical protein
MNGITDHDETELRDLFEDAVSDVHPRGELTRIMARARAETTPSPTRWLPLTVAAALATILTIGGVAWFAEQSQDVPTASPGGPGDDEDPTRSRVGRTVTVPVYYVGETAQGLRLFREFRKVQNVRGPELAIAVDEALTDSAADPDYRTGFPPNSRTISVFSDGQMVRADLTGRDLSSRPPGMSEADARTAIDAIVYTVDAVTQSQVGVQFSIDGEPTETLLGVPVGNLVERASQDQVLAPVAIFSPADGDTVGTEFRVEGQAMAFEANVVWELREGDEVVRSGFATAAECCTHSPFSFSVKAPPGDYTLVVSETDPSDGEGVGVSRDTKDITVE